MSKRPTAGQPPLDPDEPTERGTITAPASTWATLEALGDGNKSQGLRRAVDLATIQAEGVEASLIRLREGIEWTTEEGIGDFAQALLYDVAKALGLDRAAAHRIAGDEEGE